MQLACRKDDRQKVGQGLGLLGLESQGLAGPRARWRAGMQAGARQNVDWH